MSRVLSSWIEVTIPSAKMKDGAVKAALDHSVRVIGGCTMTEARGCYVRQDTGEVESEHVIVVRWDFSYRSRSLTISACSDVTNALLNSGEESVLRRRFYGTDHPDSGYKSELIFA